MNAISDGLHADREEGKDEDVVSKSIKDILLENGTITEDDAAQIQAYSEDNNVSFVNAAQETGIVTDKREISKVLAQALDIEYVSIREIEIDRDLAATLGGEFARYYKAIPISQTGGIYTFAVPVKNATSLAIKDDLKRIVNARAVQFVISALPDIERTIEDVYRADKQLKEISDQVDAEAKVKKQEQASSEVPDEVTEESKIAQFVELVLKQAVLDNASDIHFDAQEKETIIRFRIDGVLYDRATTPSTSTRAIASRIKVMASLDIANVRTPQDGRLSQNIAGRKIDFRLATLPSVYGEKIVMRILDNSSASLPLEKLGFSTKNFDRLIAKAKNPYGAVLVTGPTGSGKSTTLYSILNFLNSPTKNIITVEDPVEYRLNRINQIQVNAKQNLTFAAALRTILRADPDVILVGEIRDPETARIALEAAQTGHMVFSTLHTNDAASAMPRLAKMGVEPFIIAATMEAIVSQRLIRRLCKFCKMEYTPTELELKLGNFPHTPGEPLPTLYREVGCKECKNTGFSGRSGIHEVLVVSDTIREAISEGKSSFELNQMAVAEGMTTMRVDGYEKAMQGITTLDEINKAVSV